MPERKLLVSLLDSLPKNVRKAQIDISDSRFVKSKTLPLADLKGIKSRFPHLAIEAHLMVKRPDKLLPKYAHFADSFLMHVESLPAKELMNAIAYLKKRKKQVGIALLDTTPLARILPFLQDIDAVLLLCIERPGFQAQAFDKQDFVRIATMRAILDLKSKQRKHAISLIVDGGVNAKNIKNIVKAGADEVDCGSAVFHDTAVAKNLQALKKALR